MGFLPSANPYRSKSKSKKKLCKNCSLFRGIENGVSFYFILVLVEFYLQSKWIFRLFGLNTQFSFCSQSKLNFLFPGIKVQCIEKIFIWKMVPTIFSISTH